MGIPYTRTRKLSWVLGEGGGGDEKRGEDESMWGGWGEDPLLGLKRGRKWLNLHGENSESRESVM